MIEKLLCMFRGKTRGKEVRNKVMTQRFKEQPPSLCT